MVYLNCLDIHSLYYLNYASSKFDAHFRHSSKAVVVREILNPLQLSLKVHM